MGELMRTTSFSIFGKQISSQLSIFYDEDIVQSESVKALQDFIYGDFPCIDDVCRKHIDTNRPQITNECWVPNELCNHFGKVQITPLSMLTTIYWTYFRTKI